MQLAEEQRALEEIRGQREDRRRAEAEEALAARYKVQKELEAVQALAGSLGDENRGLRLERIALDEQLRDVGRRVRNQLNSKI